MNGSSCKKDWEFGSGTKSHCPKSYNTPKPYSSNSHNSPSPNKSPSPWNNNQGGNMQNQDDNHKSDPVPQPVQECSEEVFNEVQLVRREDCPWLNSAFSYGTGIIRLHQEINDFYNYISPTPLEHDLRLQVLQRVKNVINGLWPHAIVEFFGSFRTGLYLPTSDIDLVVFGRWESLPYCTLQQELTEKGVAEANRIKILDRAFVPLVKLTDKETDLKVDISFNRTNGIRSAEFVKKIRREMPALPKLYLVLKQFLWQRDLNEVLTGGVSSYSLFLMTLSFFQCHPRKNVGSDKSNLGVLLLEFFELYGRHFNYLKTAIRINDGGSYIAKNKLQKMAVEGPGPSLICIEDPILPDNDTGKGSYNFLSAKQAFDYAFVTLNQAISLNLPLQKDPSNFSILGLIISVNDEVLGWRDRVRNNLPIRQDPVPPTPPRATPSVSHLASTAQPNEKASK